MVNLCLKAWNAWRRKKNNLWVNGRCDIFINIETFKIIDRGSSKFLKEDFYSDYSLNIDLKPFKDLQVNIVLEFHIEQLEESLDFKGISNLKAFLGK